MTKLNFLDMIIASVAVYLVSLIVGTGYSMLKLGGLIIYMLAANLAFTLILNRRPKVTTKHKKIQVFKLWFSLSLPSLSIFYLFNIFGILTSEGVFLMLMIYISGLLFGASILRSGMKFYTII